MYFPKKRAGVFLIISAFFLYTIATTAQAGTYSVKLPNCNTTLFLSIPANFEPSFMDTDGINSFNNIPGQTQRMVALRKKIIKDKALKFGNTDYVNNWVGIAVISLSSLAKNQNNFDSSSVDILYKKAKSLSVSGAFKSFIFENKSSKFGNEYLKKQVEYLKEKGNSDVDIDLDQVSIVDVSRGENYVQIIQYFPMIFDGKRVPFLKGMKYCFIPRSGCLGYILIDAPLEEMSLESLQDLLKDTTLQ